MSEAVKWRRLILNLKDYHHCLLQQAAESPHIMLFYLRIPVTVCRHPVLLKRSLFLWEVRALRQLKIRRLSMLADTKLRVHFSNSSNEECSYTVEQLQDVLQTSVSPVGASVAFRAKTCVYVTEMLLPLSFHRIEPPIGMEWTSISLAGDYIALIAERKGDRMVIIYL
jgi:hypothetical protein